VGGSGIYTLCLQNQSYVSAVEFSVSLAHWPQLTPEQAAEAEAAAERRRVEMRVCRTEAETILTQEAELAVVEKELAQRLWEVCGGAARASVRIDTGQPKGSKAAGVWFWLGGCGVSRACCRPLSH
jgi:hypothetical protein